MPSGGARPGAGRKAGKGNKITGKRRADAIKAAKDGQMPIDYMLAVMRDPDAAITRRDDMAKAAAPYFHPKLSSIDVGGNPDGEPVRFILEGLDGK